MDWHWVDLKAIQNKCKRLDGIQLEHRTFKDYKSFLNNLQNRNLKVTLNLHPADGIRHFEDMYNDVAKAVGIDPETKEDVKFSCKSDDFGMRILTRYTSRMKKTALTFGG